MQEISWETMLFFAANSIYILAYSVTNIAWLRGLTVLAALITLPYFFFQSEPLWSALFWQLMFAAVNIFHLGLLYLRAMPTQLTEFEASMQSLVFRTLPVSDMRKLLRIAKAENLDRGDRVLKQGEDNANLFVILRGGCTVSKEGKPIAHLLPGQFIGEMSYLSRKQVSADVVCREKTCIVSWDGAALEKFLNKEPELHKYLVSLLGNDLVEKLSGSHYGAVHK